MMSIEEKRRELFEAGINIRTRARNEHGDYVLPEVRDRWDGFNAALDAVAIELPESWVPIDAQERGWEMIGKLRAAVEAAGLKVKQ